MEKIDRLFLEKDCSMCSAIRAELDMKTVTEDSFVGKDGQKFLVFASLSNDASLDLLKKYGLEGKNMPVLVTYTGEVRTSLNHILGWLRVENMSLKK